MSHPPGARVQRTTTLAVTITTSNDPVRDEHDITGLYVERHWLPVLGPTCFVLARHLTRNGVHYDVTYGELAQAIGVGPTKVRDAVKRLVSFGPAHWAGDRLVLPYRWPDAPAPLDWTALP